MAEFSTTHADTEVTSEESAKKRKKSSAGGVAGQAVKESVDSSIQAMDRTYAKPDYTGNRGFYDSQKAKVDFKKQSVSSGKVKDPYTGKQLEATIKQAKAKYGDNWAEHVAEVDHVKPLKRIADEYKDSAFVSTEDIRDAANQEDNLQTISRKVNNAKRDRTNEELADDTAYRKDKHLKLSKKSRDRMKAEGEDSDFAVATTIRGKQVVNVAKEAHTAGMASAQAGMAVGGIITATDNIVAVIKGEKTAAEAMADTAKGVLTTGAVSYGLGGGLSVVGHALSQSSSPFIQGLVRAGVPGQIVGVVMATGGTLLRYAKGEINTGQCMQELGRTGVNIGITGYSMAVGQALIPIPFVGAAVGALVGGVISAALWKPLGTSFASVREAERRAEEAEANAREYIRRMEAWRLEFENAMAQLMQSSQEAFDEGYYAVLDAAVKDDFDGMAKGLDRICNAFGQSLPVKTFEEFDAIMSDKNVELEL